MRLRGYPETEERVDAAFRAGTKQPRQAAALAAKRALLRLQYNGTRAFFERSLDAIAVAWNGLNGSRRVFMDAARDAGARTLYFELSPFPSRITVDPCGVNYGNGLPRTIEPYSSWAGQRENGGSWHDLREMIRARPSAQPRVAAAPDRTLDGPFIFVPLQVPGDSQLRLYGGAFRTVEATIEAVAEAAINLPDGWHVRLKEHPSAGVSFAPLIAGLEHPNLVLDNATDTFAQVAAARCVVTVNSSVGLEAMFFDKPVVALGHSFWAFPEVAVHCPTRGDLTALFRAPERLSFDPTHRECFLNYLIDEYYPRLDGGEGGIPEAEAAKIRRRIEGPDRLGFWSCREGCSS